jgi:hypothetical protein
MSFDTAGSDNMWPPTCPDNDGKRGKEGDNSHAFPRFPWIRDVEDVARVVGPHARLKIARFTSKGLRYLATDRAGQFSLDDMLTRFGGGDYYIRAFDGRRYVQAFRVALDYTVPPRDP